MKELFKDWKGKIIVNDEEVDSLEDCDFEAHEKIFIRLEPPEKKRRRKIHYGRSNKE